MPDNGISQQPAQGRYNLRNSKRAGVKKNNSGQSDADRHESTGEPSRPGGTREPSRPSRTGKPSQTSGTRVVSRPGGRRRPSRPSRTGKPSQATGTREVSQASGTGIASQAGNTGTASQAGDTGITSQAGDTGIAWLAGDSVGTPLSAEICRGLIARGIFSNQRPPEVRITKKGLEEAGFGNLSAEFRANAQNSGFLSAFVKSWDIVWNEEVQD